MRYFDSINLLRRKLAVLGFCFFTAAAAQSAGSGGNAADFLNISPDPRTTATGEGSYAEISAFPGISYANPAGLLGVSRPLVDGSAGNDGFNLSLGYCRNRFFNPLLVRNS